MASSRAVWTRKPSTSSVVPAAVPIPTVSIRTPRSAAAPAASSGPGSVVFSPSVTSTMIAGAYVPFGTGVGTGVGAGEALE